MHIFVSSRCRCSLPLWNVICISFDSLKSNSNFATFSWVSISTWQSPCRSSEPHQFYPNSEQPATVPQSHPTFHEISQPKFLESRSFVINGLGTLYSGARDRTGLLWKRRPPARRSMHDHGFDNVTLFVCVRFG